jgi:hypothetical protein
MVHRINLVRFTRKSFASETLAPSAASIAGKIQYVRVRHPNVNYVRMEHFYLIGRTFLFNKKSCQIFLTAKNSFRISKAKFLFFRKLHYAL